MFVSSILSTKQRGLIRSSRTPIACSEDRGYDLPLHSKGKNPFKEESLQASFAWQDVHR